MDGLEPTLSTRALSCPIRGVWGRSWDSESCKGAEISLDAIDCHYRRGWVRIEGDENSAPLLERHSHILTMLHV